MTLRRLLVHVVSLVGLLAFGLQGVAAGAGAVWVIDLGVSEGKAPSLFRIEV